MYPIKFAMIYGYDAFIRVINIYDFHYSIHILIFYIPTMWFPSGGGGMSSITAEEF